MPFETGTSTSQADFISKLLTFAVNNAGYTQDDYDTGNKRAALHKGTAFFQFLWDNTASGGSIALYQSTSWSAGTPFGQATGSGNQAQTAGNITTGRIINNIGNGAFTSYCLFCYSGSDVVHAVLEFSPGQYRHMSFGTIEKFGDWTGGEYIVGHHWALGSISDDYVNPAHSLLADGGNTADSVGAYQGSLHIEGMPNGDASSKFGIIHGNTTKTTAAGTDVAGNNRVNIISGSGRSGPWMNAYGKYETSQFQGFVPLIPFPLFYFNRTTTPKRLYFLGYLPNVRMVNIAAFEAQAEVALGADTWKVFPAVRKQLQNNNDTAQSGNMGVAYLKTP